MLTSSCFHTQWVRSASKTETKIRYTEEFLTTLKAEIENLSRLRLTDEELEYMVRNCRFLPRVYWEWLSFFRFDPEKIEVNQEWRECIKLSDDASKHTGSPEELKACLYELRLNRSGKPFTN